MRRARHLTVGSRGWAGDPGEWDGYRFGSETCPTLLPTTSELAGAARAFAPERCVLVTSLLGPDEFPRSLRAASTALDAGWSEVVVNDWGLLDELSRRGADRLSAGRLIMRFRRGPGRMDPWRDLDEESRRYFAWGPLYDGPFMEFLRGKGVRRVEADPPRHPWPVPETTGIAISLHAKERLVTLAASCPWLYDPVADAWADHRTCARPCRARGDILLHARPLAHPLRLQGCATVEPIEEAVPEDLPPWVDRLIFDGEPVTGTFPA